MTSLSISSSAIKCKAISEHFLKTSAEKKGGADVSIDERAEGLTGQHRRRLLVSQEEKELFVRPVLSLSQSTP